MHENRWRVRRSRLPHTSLWMVYRPGGTRAFKYFWSWHSAMRYVDSMIREANHA